ncbi:hypothetical protein N8Z10_00160 [bacterium]|nr:hypothetical protein [bacterium]
MSEYCHNHKLYEDASTMSLNPGMNLAGMGATTLPNMAVSFAAQNGSGDKAPSLLPLAMQVAAQTIGLDLVPVVPMAGPMGLLSYLDFTYEGGTLGSANGADGSVAPTYIKGSETLLGVGNIAAVAGTNGEYTFVGSSRIDGKSIFKVVSIDGANANVAADLEALATGAGVTVELVKGLEDHIKGFTASDEDGTPYSREAGESTADKIMGLSLFSKSVAAETFQVAAAVTREQVQDLKQFGVDAVAQVEAVLTNELTQSINQHILKRLRALGTANVTAAFVANGFDLDLPLASALGGGGETLPSVHRRILSQVLAAANLIANRGRRGAGNFAVVGPQTATVLQSVSGFVANPMANTFAQAAGAIYPLGSVAGINVYTDPTMAWGDYSVTVGRKGDGNGPGVVFMPYLMAESVQTIAEGTMAPKIAVKSRFALVDAGFHPETQYVTFKVTIGTLSTKNLLTLA